MPRTDHRLRLAIGVAALSVLPYLNGLGNGFTFDDVPIVAENARLRPPIALGALFGTDWWDGTRPMSRLYRPLTMGSFAIDHAVARRIGDAPAPARLLDAAAFPFHVQNILWHAAASVALLWLVLELFASPMLAAVTAALFAVHPVHTEAVNGIVGRAELISACLGFLSLLVAWRTIRDDSDGMRRPALAGGLLLGALLAKEQAIALPVVLIAGLALQAPGATRERISRASVRRVLIALGVVVIGYLAARAAVLGTLTGVGETAPGALNVDNPVASASGLARLFTPVRVFGEVLRLLAAPRTLSADYSYDQIPVVTSPDLATVVCAIALCGLAAGVFLLRRRQPAVAAGIFFCLATWVLTSNLVVTIGTILGERLLYLPSAGACLVIAAGLLAVGRRLRAPWLTPAAATVLVLAGAGRTWVRNFDWKDNLTLFASATVASPRSCKAWNGYASELLARGRAREALPAAARSLAIDPRYPEAHQTLAKIDRALANDESAGPARDALRADAKEHARVLVEVLSTGLDGGTGLADAWNTLGAIALDEGDLDAAESAYRAAATSRPDDVASVNGLGVVLSLRAERETDPARRGEQQRAALAQFDRALALDPAFAEARQNAAAARRALASRATDPTLRDELIRRADADEGRAVTDRRATADVDALANLHGVRGERLLGEKRHADALAEFEEAARLRPRAARAFLGIGSVYASQAEGEPDPQRRQALLDRAIAAFERASALAPGDPTAHLDLAVTYLRQKREPAKVAAHFREFLRLAPTTPMRAQVEQTIREMDALAARGRR
jgi:tetratricopeptide (TPR) repeat protein/uncharacterized membrane protein YozB (DUF420 family)